MKRWMCLLAFLISIGTSAFGQEEPVVTTLVLQESGTLLDLLSDEQVEQTEKIVISGNSLSSKDFAVLKTMIIQHKLTEVDIENTATAVITTQAFEGCSNLVSIKLPKFLISTGWYGFRGCTGLTDIDLPASVTSIANSFRGCSNLQSITLGRNVQSIDGQSFLYCFGLKEVHCKGSVPPACELGSFENSYEVCTLYVPEGYKKTYAFADGWLNFENIQEEYVEPPYKLQVELNGGTEAQQIYPTYGSAGGNVLKWIRPSEECVIEAEKDEEVVIEISEQTTSISDWKIESILLNNEDITAQLKEYNRLYLTIDQDSKLEINMKDLNEPIDDKSVDVTLEVAGTLLHQLSEVSLSSITDLCVKGPMNKSDFDVIKKMTWLKKVDLSMAVLKDNALPSYAFSCVANDIEKVMSHLREVILPEGLLEIGDGSFSYLYQLEKINIPTSVKRIGANSFEMCRSLNTIDLSLLINLENIGYSAFSHCAGIPVSVVFPASLKTIDNYAFSDNNIESVVLSETQVEFIGNGAFNNCPIEGTLVFPATLNYILSDAFNAATVTSIKFKSPKIIDGTDTFGSVDRLSCQLYVPKGLGTTYKADTYWSAFGNNIVEFGNLVTVTTNNSLGYTMGGGAYEAGETVTLTAKLHDYYENVTFGGWYENGKKVSSDLTYSFTMDNKDHEIEVRFLGGQTIINGIIDDAKKNNGLNVIIDNPTIVEGDKLWDLNSLGFLWGYNPSLLVNSPMHVDNVSVYTDWMYLQTQNHNGWLFVCFPYDLKVSDIVQRDGVDGQFVVREYDGSSRAANGIGASWRQLGKDEVMEAGKGYIFRSNRIEGYKYNSSIDDMNKLFNRQAVTIPLAKHASSVTADANWNLVGNPFPCYFSVKQLFNDGLDGTVTVWSDQIQNYEYYTKDDEDVYLAPLTAFFIQHNQAANVTFKPEGRAATLPTTRAAVADLRSDAGREVINLQLANDSLSDKTRLVFNEAASTDYELGKDAAKFSSLNNNAPSLYTLDAQNQQLAINERPVGNGVVRLGCYIGVKGSYTISAKEALVSDLYLYDAETGAFCNLREESYAFTAEAGVCNNRFELRTSLKGTGIEAIEGLCWQVEGNHLQLNGLPAGAQVSLFDANGRAWFAGDAATATQGIALPQSGIYYLTIRTAEGRSFTEAIKR